MGILVWILFGALVGWIASMVMGTNAQQGAVANIIIGIIGAVIGGFIARALSIGDVTGFNFGSLLIALGGAVLLIAVVRIFSPRSTM